MFPGSVSGRLILSVTTNGTAGGRDIPIEKRLVSPVRRDGRRHGQTDVVFSEQARDGRTAGLAFPQRHDGAGRRAFEGFVERGFAPIHGVIPSSSLGAASRK